MVRIKSIALAFWAGSLVVASCLQAQEQVPYDVAIQVNDRVITTFEIDQRKLLLIAFNSSGDLEKLAKDQLIEDRLRLQAATQAGLTISDQEVDVGVEEFADRANITAEQLYQAIDLRGINRQTMRDFVRAGLLWRNLVRARFERSSFVSEEEIDSMLNLIPEQKQQSILFSEIYLPLDKSGDGEALKLARKLSRSIKTEAEFASAARKYSKAKSSQNGGRLDWLSVADLSANLVGKIMQLQPGEVTAPITLGTSIGIFQLHGVRDDKTEKDSPAMTVTYVLVKIPGKPGSKKLRSNAEQLISDADTCADLRAQAERFAIPGHTDHEQEVSQIPGAVAKEIERLDRNEARIFTREENTLSVVMLCDRVRELPEDARKNLRIDLSNERITGFKDGYLQELKGDAVIVYR